MNLTVLLIAAYLPLVPVMAAALRSGAFGRGSAGMLLRLFFLGVLAAVPAFLMEAGGMLAVSVAMRLLAGKNGHAALSAVLRYLLAAALIEEAWKHFVLRTSTWEKMTMGTVADGIAASVVVGAGFSAVLYGAWQASALIVPKDMEVLRAAMPDFLRAGPVAAFMFALLYIPSHFGYAGFMGALYGVAKGSEQKNHGARAGFMLAVSVLLPVLAHGTFAASLGYGMAENRLLWMAIGFAGEAVLALLIGSAMRAARQASLDALAGPEEDDGTVDFGDSEEFAEFAEAAGLPGGQEGQTAGALEDHVYGNPEGRTENGEYADAPSEDMPAYHAESEGSAADLADGLAERYPEHPVEEE